MSSPLRVPLEDLRAGEMRLPADAARYVFRVHRKRRGDEIILFDPRAGLLAQATIAGEGVVYVEPPRRAPECSMPVSLIQAVGKADKPEQVVRDATALGVQRISFVSTARSVAKSAGPERQGRLLRVAVEAARQSLRGDLPELTTHRSLESLFEERGPSEELRLLCAVSEQAEPLAGVVQRTWGESGGAALPPLLLLIGPEGGFEPDEIEAARRVGFTAVGLGPLVLRTETAAIAALGYLRLLWAASRPAPSREG